MATRAIAWLRKQKIDFTVETYDHLTKGAAFAAKATGFPLNQTVKTLVADLDGALPRSKGAPAADKLLAHDDLSALFGLDLAIPGSEAEAQAQAQAEGAQPAAPLPASKPPARASKGRHGRRPKAPKDPRDDMAPAYELTPDGFVKWWE